MKEVVVRTPANSVAKRKRGSACAYPRCQRPAYLSPDLEASDQCIFHAEKKDPQEFRDAMARQIREWRNTEISEWDFRGWRFVDTERSRPSRDKSSSNMFYHAVFPHTANFSDAVFIGNADFSSARFLRDAYFHGTVFAQNADFYNLRVEGNALFSWAQFGRQGESHRITFSGAVFKRGAHFSDVDFWDWTCFYRTSFAQFAWFDLAKFHGHADFALTKFDQGVSFWRAVFAANVDYRAATFERELDWKDVYLTGRANFVDVIIGGKARLYWSKTYNYWRGDETHNSTGHVLISAPYFTSPNSIVDMRGNLLGIPGQLVIQGVHRRLDNYYRLCTLSKDQIRHLIVRNNMGSILLEGTDCTKIRFYDCEWPSRRDGRRIVADEGLLLTRKRHDWHALARVLRIAELHRIGLLRTLRWKRPYHLIALTYQQLAKRHREELDHPLANDFERGIFEMRRLAGKQEGGRKGWSDYVLFTLYKWISNYSGSLVRPVLWLLSSLVLFAWAYWGTSFKTDVSPFLWNSFKLSAEVAYLNRSAFDFALHNNFVVDLLMASQIITTATLATLFVFSIRRRFKHE